MGSVVLIGAEDVRAASNSLRGAAADVNTAASRIEFAFEQHQRFLETFLQRFEELLERKAERGTQP